MGEAQSIQKEYNVQFKPVIIFAKKANNGITTVYTRCME